MANSDKLSRRDILLAGAAAAGRGLCSGSCARTRGEDRAERQDHAGDHRDRPALHLRSESHASVHRCAVRGDRRCASQTPRCGQGPGRSALRQQRLRPVPRLPRTLGSQGYRRCAGCHRRSLARCRFDLGGQGGQGRLQRKAPAASRSPLARNWQTRCIARSGCFRAGTQRRSVPNFQKAVEWVHAGKLGKLKTMHASVYIPTLDNSWLPSQPAPSRDVVDWNLWLGPAAWASVQSEICRRRLARQWDFDSGAPTARLGCPHGGSVSMGQQSR